MSKIPKHIVKEVIERAKGVCDRCSEFTGNMHIHHRNFDRSCNELYNLDYLCHECHNQVHWIINRYQKGVGFKGTQKMLYKDKLYNPKYRIGGRRLFW